jgi:epsin
MLIHLPSSPSDFYEIMDMLDKRLNDKGKNWRHVLKSLKVLDYCLHEGSELVVTWARKNIYIIKTLREFQYVDEEGRDVGQNGMLAVRSVGTKQLTFPVRVSAKELTSLILDEDRLRSERSDRKLWKTRVTGIDEHGPLAISGPSVARPKERAPRPQRPDEEDAEYRLAIEASKHEAEEDKKRRAKNAASADDDDDLAKAIRLSKEEEELRRRELEDQNAASLFDDTPAPAQPQATGWNQGYQQQPAVDWFGNPLQQQPQTTGYLNNQYAQPQQAGLQNGYTNGFGAQPTGFDQFQQQQPQPSFLQQQSTIQPQQTAFNNNPYGQSQPNDAFGHQSPQQPFPQAGSQNPWASNQQQQADTLKPMPTGSNNPFAQNFRQQQQQQQPLPSKTNIPTLNTLYEQQTATQFNRPTQPNPIANYQAPVQQQQQQQVQQKPENPQHAILNALLASGEGQDTFGNVGDLRIPAQHTAPGTFVNSAGGGLDRLRAAQTGNNPFFQQQFTGVGPTQGGFGQQVAAQTGPAGGFGGGFGQQNNNPFGTRPGPPQQSNSLIDL